jgi:hypothetical protein
MSSNLARILFLRADGQPQDLYVQFEIPGPEKLEQQPTHRL